MLYENDSFEIINIINKTYLPASSTQNMTSSSENDTSEMFPPPPVFDDTALIQSVILSIMFVISFLGNSTTLILIYGSRRPLSNTAFLIGNLALSDLIVTFFCTGTDAIWTYTVQWYAGTWGCKIIKYIQCFGLYLSTYIIVVIGVDRCSAVIDPLGHSKAKARVYRLVTGSWVVSAIFSLPQLYIFHVLRGPFKDDFYQCVTHGTYSARWQEQLYSALSLLLLYALPLLSLVTAYTLIFCTITRQSSISVTGAEFGSIQDSNPHSDSARLRLLRRAKTRSLLLTTLIVVAFIVCWTPYQVTFIIHTFFGTSDDDLKHTKWIFCFGIANSMFNPLIYGIFHLCSRRRRKSTLRKGESRLQIMRSTR